MNDLWLLVRVSNAVNDCLSVIPANHPLHHHLIELMVDIRQASPDIEDAEIL